MRHPIATRRDPMDAGAEPVLFRVRRISRKSPMNLFSCRIGDGLPGMMRLTVDSLRYLLMIQRNIGRWVPHIDTLASADSTLRTWLEVDALELPPAPKGATLAIDCWRGDSAATGSLGALTHRQLEVSGRHSRRVGHRTPYDAHSQGAVDDVECLNDGGALLTDSQRRCGSTRRRTARISWSCGRSGSGSASSSG
jgi:hypothetical protein